SARRSWPGRWPAGGSCAWSVAASAVVLCAPCPSPRLLTVGARRQEQDTRKPLLDRRPGGARGCDPATTQERAYQPAGGAPNVMTHARNAATLTTSHTSRI